MSPFEFLVSLILILIMYYLLISHLLILEFGKFVLFHIGILNKLELHDT